MVIERYEEERPTMRAPRLGDARVLAEGWAGPPSAEAHEAELRDPGRPQFAVSL
jgi:hydrogenase maturation protease